jgi:hypothetical protein
MTKVLLIYAGSVSITLGFTLLYLLYIKHKNEQEINDIINAMAELRKTLKERGLLKDKPND